MGARRVVDQAQKVKSKLNLFGELQGASSRVWAMPVSIDNLTRSGPEGYLGQSAKRDSSSPVDGDLL